MKRWFIIMFYILLPNKHFPKRLPTPIYEEMVHFLPQVSINIYIYILHNNIKFIVYLQEIVLIFT